MRHLSRFTISLGLTCAFVMPAFADEPAAKNVILMISDGIGFNGWLAADYYQGKAGSQSYQIARPDGTEPRLYGQTHWSVNPVDENGNLVSDDEADQAAGVVEQYYDPTTRWNRFENTFLNDFAPVGQSYTSYTDSSSAATALYTGRKTVNGRINKDWKGEIDFVTIAQIANAQGRATGAVSTVQVSHATPGAVWSHAASRNSYADIFNDMVGSGLDVIMGAGHPDFDRSGRRLEDGAERDYKFVGGEETWTALTSEEGHNDFAFIEEKSDFEALAAGENLPRKVVGVMQSISTAQSDRSDLDADEANPSGMAFVENVPSLATMTQASLNVLNQNETGFFVMIEGGAVDWMGHANDMPRYIEEQIDFNLAVDAAIEWIEENSNWEETLLIVTSDHETGGIWGEGTYANGSGPAVADPSDKEAIEAARFDPTQDRFNDYLAVQDRGAGSMPGYQFSSGNHTNELVPLWAIGSGSQLFDEARRVDVRAAKLWGNDAAYDWDGSFIDNTSVFDVMNRVLSTDHLESRAGL
ncbi:hypothetical protein GTW25_13960 [Aliihoeflea aestuarii]|jgi:alkaline phosphatase|uniref:alkaline phosphatase n=1 Tax=Aliihoeflea aestuarii TaxID=453840 RepID=UPI00209421C7|nr:alkaline phosphatase [Aliihoeflea aestuarii]MCO6392137.1 hypothetical protein [Aliihoeflea aestuarii]